MSNNKITTDFRRTKTSRKNDFYGLVDTWHLYLQLDCKAKVKKKTYTSVLYDFTKFLADELCEKGIIHFPEHTGLIKIQGQELKIKINPKTGLLDKRTVDWGETNKLWAESPEAKEKKKVIFHMNEHSDFITYGIKWSKTKLSLKNKSTFIYLPCRHLKRRVAKMIKSGKEYFVIENRAL